MAKNVIYYRFFWLAQRCRMYYVVKPKHPRERPPYYSKFYEKKKMYCNKKCILWNVQALKTRKYGFGMKVLGSKLPGVVDRTRLIVAIKQLWKISTFSPLVHHISNTSHRTGQSLPPLQPLLLFLLLLADLQLQRRIIILTGLTGRGRRAATWIVTCVKGRARRRRSGQIYQCVLL